MKFPHIAYGTPRKLPKAKTLPGRVAVVDIAFASNAGGASFEKTTLPFIDGLGDRLALWIDHHDHEKHVDYADDPRFILATKKQHGACPEMVTRERVELAGPIDVICCHTDFDGLCAAAKWIRGGLECYEGADRDAHAIDTRLGKPSERARIMDHALRAKPHDESLRGLIIRYLAEGAQDAALLATFRETAALYEKKQRRSQRLAARYEIRGDLAVCDATDRDGPYDKTELLLLGQTLAKIALVYDESAVTVAAAFDSGIDLVSILKLDGGMPTRVSVTPRQLDSTIAAIAAYLDRSDS